MTARPENNLQPPANCVALAVEVRATEDGARLTREVVSNADLADVFSEAWRDGCLRKGHPHIPFAGLPMRIVPRFKTGSDQRCAGFDVEVPVPRGSPARQSFSTRSLSHVGNRAAQRLVETGVLNAGQAYLYEIVLGHPAPPPAALPDNEPFRATVKSPPLTHLDVPLRQLLEQSAAVDVVEDDMFPVFYTGEAFALAEKFARRGGEAVPAVETGGVLVGSLCSCPQSGEFFTVVTDVLEVLDADQTEFALSYTNKSWTRLQTIMRARQAAHPERAERILGQCHGHNFLPNDGKTCEGCLQRPTCSLNNLFTSLDDQNWSRAVFARQPWQLCHIFGLAARGDKVNALFSLLDGRLQPRGFFKLPYFDPEQWTPKPVLEETSHAQT